MRINSAKQGKACCVMLYRYSWCHSDSEESFLAILQLFRISVTSLKTVMNAAAVYGNNIYVNLKLKT